VDDAAQIVHGPPPDELDLGRLDVRRMPSPFSASRAQVDRVVEA
jgi:hypothetical protein